MREVTIEKVLLAAGMGLVAYLVLFRTPSLASAGPKQITSGDAQDESLDSAELNVAVPPLRKPVALGRVYLLQQDARALVDSYAVRYSDNQMKSCRQEGSGSVRIFAPGEVILASSADLNEGRFYAAEKETSPLGIATTQFKRYYTGSGDNLKAMLKGVGDEPDYDPYTDQAFSPHGEAIRRALARTRKPISATPDTESWSPSATRIPPSFARRMR